MERWSGRVAVVTGASAGIGAAIAQELVKKGLKVVGLARRVERVEELSAALSSEAGKLYPLKCDIIREADIKEAFRWIKLNLGGVDILVNNAGVASENSLMGGPVDSWRSILELNVLALSICTKEAIQSMRERSVEDGHIIHMNRIVFKSHGLLAIQVAALKPRPYDLSVAGHTMPPTIFPIYMYAASKHAVTILTEGLRRELVEQNSNIRVTSISPGLVKTEILAASRKTLCSESVYRNFVHLEAKDVADAVLYVLGTPQHVQVHELVIRPNGEIS